MKSMCLQPNPKRVDMSTKWGRAPSHSSKKLDRGSLPRALLLLPAQPATCTTGTPGIFIRRLSCVAQKQELGNHSERWPQKEKHQVEEYQAMHPLVSMTNIVFNNNQRPLARIACSFWPGYE